MAEQPDHIIQFFAYEHLPPHLRQVSVLFAMLADKIVAEIHETSERAALRKLLEAKDAAVRAVLAKP